MNSDTIAISGRLPEAMLQKLRLIVANNKNTRQGPDSQNAIIVEALRDWLAKREPAEVRG